METQLFDVYELDQNQIVGKCIGSTFATDELDAVSRVIGVFVDPFAFCAVPA